MKKELETEIQTFLNPFIDFCSLSGVQFPILPITYTLWRKVCYKKVTEKYSAQKDQNQERQIKRCFVKVSQRKLLPKFIQKVQSQIDGKSVGWKKAILKADELKLINTTEYQQLLFEYCQNLYQMEFWIQMFHDLVSIPYSDTYDENKQYLTNEKFKSSFYEKKNQSFINKACDKVGKNILTKGLSKLSETLLTNRAIYGISTVIGGFNPLMFAATFSINYAIQSHEKYSKQRDVISQLKQRNTQIIKNLNELKQAYERCLTCIQAMIQLDINQKQPFKREKQKFLNILSKVLQEDWLEIKVTKQGDWEFVQLKNKDSLDSFENIQFFQ